MPLGSARLRLRTPMPADCQHRPRSRIAIEGPYATSSDWTIPGDRTGTCLRTAAGRLVCSDGDRCSRTSGGGLLFRSGLFASPGGPMVRIEIRLPRLVGPGLYRTMPVSVTALGPAHVRAIVGIGPHGWTTFRSQSTVTVQQATGVTLSGRFHTTLATMAAASARTASGAARPSPTENPPCGDAATAGLLAFHLGTLARCGALSRACPGEAPDCRPRLRGAAERPDLSASGCERCGDG